MQKKLYLMMLCLCCFAFGEAQKSSFSKIPSVGSSLSDFIPKDCDTLATATGDLNKDGKDDVAAVVFNKHDNSDEAERWLLILFKTNEGYTLAAKTGKVIMCSQCGGVFGDPFAGIGISNGVLTVSHYGGSAWRWGDDVKFRYQNNAFYLIGKNTHSYWDVKHCDKYNDFAGTEIEETNFVTGDHYVKKISENCKLLADKKNKIKIKPLVKLVNYKTDN